MKHTVIKYFNCKESGEDYSLGSFYVSSDYDRVQLLANLGFIIANEKVETLKVVEKKQTTRQRTPKKVADNNASKD